MSVCCLIAGFLVAALIFGGPWHLPLAWGDIPTWLAVVAAAVGGWAALWQLRSQQKQIAEEADRNRKRDELLDKQLDKLDRQAETFSRQQAEQVEVSRKDSEQDTRVYMYNGSARPIWSVTCRIMPVFDKSEPVSPVENEIEGSPDPEDHHVGKMLESILPKKRGVFIFVKRTKTPNQNVVAWFRDDAGSRWQLEENLRLVPADDHYKYV